MSVAAKSRAEALLSRKPIFTYPKDEPVFYVTRLFGAPRDLVWKAMTEPKLVAQWWGPRKYVTEVKEMDFSVGGKWRFVNKGAEGANHEFFGEYREIVPPEKIVQTFGFMDYPPAVETMTLEEQGGYTKMSVHSRFPNAQMRDGMVTSGMESGATETYERLDAVLGDLQGEKAPLAGRELTITRVLDAPRELVWKAWTDAKYFAAWWGPYAFSTPECELDVRAGGKLRFVMANPAMPPNEILGEFVEVRAPERLVFTSQGFFGTEKPKIEQFTEIDLYDEGGKTRMVLHTVMLSATPDMARAVSGWPIGWGQSLDKLDAMVAILKMTVQGC